MISDTDLLGEVGLSAKQAMADIRHALLDVDAVTQEPLGRTLMQGLQLEDKR